MVEWKYLNGLTSPLTEITDRIKGGGSYLGSCWDFYGDDDRCVAPLTSRRYVVCVIPHFLFLDDWFDNSAQSATSWHVIGRVNGDIIFSSFNIMDRTRRIAVFAKLGMKTDVNETSSQSLGSTRSNGICTKCC